MSSSISAKHLITPQWERCIGSSNVDLYTVDNQWTLLSCQFSLSPSHVGLFFIAQVKILGEKFWSKFPRVAADWRRETWGRGCRSPSVNDSPCQPIGSLSASASLPSGGGRGRAGRLPKRGVCVGVNGWRREAGASMSGTGALDQHSWAGIGHTAGSGLHSSTKQDCEKRGK